MDLVSVTSKFNLYGDRWPFYTQNFNLGPGKIVKPHDIGYDEEEDKKNGIYIDEISKIRIVPKNYDHTTRFFNTKGN